MPRTTSLQRAMEALGGLGLIVSLEVRRHPERRHVLDQRIWVLNPAEVIRLSKERDLYGVHVSDRTVGMVLMFDDDGKFNGGNYAQLHYADYDLRRKGGYEVRTGTYSWQPDERTLKAALSFLQGFSPVGQAEAARQAQEAAEAAEKAEQERQANLAALNQSLEDNPDTRGWAGAVASTVAYERRRAIAELRDFAKRCTESADRLEAGDKASRLWFHPTSVMSIVEHLSKLEALEETVDGPLADLIKAVQERYGY